MAKNHIKNIVEVDELPDNCFEIHEVFGHKMNRYYYLLLDIKKLYPILQEWFNNKISQLPITDKYTFSFNVEGKWHHRPFNEDVYQKLQQNFKEGCLLYDMEKYNPINDIESGQMYVEVPEWSMFNIIHIHKNKSVRANNDRGGNFFNYLIRTDIKQNLKEI